MFLTAITTDMITRVEMPAAVRLSLFLIQILNYMWIEAIFVNRREVGIGVSLVVTTSSILSALTKALAKIDLQTPHVQADRISASSLHRNATFTCIPAPLRPLLYLRWIMRSAYSELCVSTKIGSYAVARRLYLGFYSMCPPLSSCMSRTRNDL